MELEQAQELAEAAKAELVPYCQRIEIAGSIRRKKPEPGDIELVCIPASSELMGFVEAVNKWPKIMGKPTGRYTQRVYNGVKLDLFICRPETWAVNLTIRTGSASFSKALAERTYHVNLRFKDAQLWTTAGTLIKAPLSGINEEADVFKALKIKWVEPDGRYGAFNVVPEN